MNNICEELRVLFKCIEGYNCFACSPNNKIGLNLNILKEKDHFTASFVLGNLYSGFPGIIHGGIQATIIDEIGFWAMFEEVKTMGFTTGLNIEYLNKLETDRELKAVSRDILINKDETEVTVEILDGSKVCTLGKLKYKLIKDNVIKRYFGDSFYKSFLEIKKKYD